MAIKKGIMTQIDWAYIGAVLANTGDDSQVEFFTSFLKECRSWGTNHQVEKQLACVNALLSDEDKEALKMLSYTGEE